MNGARTVGWFLGNFLAGDLGDIGSSILKFGRIYSKSKILGEPTALFTSSSFAKLSVEAKMLRLGGPVAALVAFAAFLPAGIKDFKNAQANGASDAELAYRAFACIGGTIGGGISAAVDASQKGESAGIVAASFFAGLFGMYDPDNPGGFIEGVQRNRAEHVDQLNSRDALEGLVIPPNPKTGDPGFNGQNFVSKEFQAPAYNVGLENAFYDYMKTYHPTSPAYVPRVEGVNGTYSGKNWFWAPNERPLWRIKGGVQGPVTSVDSLEIYKRVDQPEPGSILYSSSVSNTGGEIGGEYNPGPGGFGCWVARGVYGENNPSWLAFREWLVNDAPSWFRKLYFRYGPKFAEFIKNKPRLKTKIKAWMDTKIDSHIDFGASKYIRLMAQFHEEKTMTMSAIDQQETNEMAGRARDDGGAEGGERGMRDEIAFSRRGATTPCTSLRA